MRNLALVLVFVALFIGLALALVKNRSRFAIGWAGVGTVSALSLPAAVVGRWVASAAFVIVGLVLTAALLALDRRDEHEAREKERGA
jgi:predicted branched-subunit amino acid permease